MSSLLKLCDEQPATVRPEATVQAAIETMLERRVGGVAVVDDENRVAGIFTERDVLQKVSLSGRESAKIPVSEVMTTPVEMATEETTESEALTFMIERHVRHLPIVDRDYRLLGILSLRNLLQARVDDLAHELDALEQYVSNDGPGG